MYNIVEEEEEEHWRRMAGIVLYGRVYLSALSLMTASENGRAVRKSQSSKNTLGILVKYIVVAVFCAIHETANDRMG